MPQKHLHLRSKEISQKLKRNTLSSGLCALAGFSLLIPAFSVEGSKFDYQEFCFLPPTIPKNVTYCTGKRLKKGIAWRVALEATNNQEFQSKVTFLKFLPAQNPNAGVYGVCGAGFLMVSFLLFKQGTDDLSDNLDLLIWNKKSLVLERAFKNEQHISIEALKNQQEQEFVKDLMMREHAEAMYTLMGDGEKELAAKQHHTGEQLNDTQLLLQLAALKAEIASQQEKEVKHKVEIAKLNKPVQGSQSGHSTMNADEAAKEELIEKLKAHEGGWLYTVVNTNKPVFVIGSQGSWKSYCCATIALLRYFLKGQKIISITDPHFNKNADEAWIELMALEPECYGGAQDWLDVDVGIQYGFNRWNHRTLKDEPVTSIWDEQTNWILHDECAKSAKEFMGRVISDPRKSNEGVLVITHSFTNAGTGGSAGFAASREEGVLQLRLNADNEMRPLFKGKLLGFKDEEGELIDELKVTVPKDWFNPSAIKKLFSKF
jgi:hypothetical protein